MFAENCEIWDSLTTCLLYIGINFLKRLQNYANIPRYQSLREAGAGFAQFFSMQSCGQMFRKSGKSGKIKKDLTALISTFA